MLDLGLQGRAVKCGFQLRFRDQRFAIFSAMCARILIFLSTLMFWAVAGAAEEPGSAELSQQACAGCPAEDGTGRAQTESARGAALLAPMKTELKQALMAGMQKGPLNAISVCKVQAPEIADSLSIDGIRIGRTSHRLRNPENQAPEWVNVVLQAYLREEKDHAPQVVSLANDREGYVEPITIKPVCLACHGENLAADVATQINTLYTDDEATGFKVDELRGVFWVEYPVAE